MRLKCKIYSFLSLKLPFTLICLVLLKYSFLIEMRWVINIKVTYLRLIFKIKDSMICFSILIYTGCFVMSPADHDIWGLLCDFCVKFLVDQCRCRWDFKLGVTFEVNCQINVPKLRVKRKRSNHLDVKSLDCQSSDIF